ncbi:hypothetical protein Agabi119p4_10300 [Agaricus bisporus var. burnettii]|uniref:Uncharacterized protein n=1 Tax=Agaricus bisporus var. burnettii TaxID=192524 RepID=A0A8H7C214_AGABI|nr:hypothetical protein Agabi119p4_10300 [Agaricus bisporus var. burnettii]
MSTPALQSFRVSRPEPTSRLYRLLIILFTLTALLGAYFAYRPVNKTQSNKWWIFDARRSAMPHSLPTEHASSCDNSVEDKINDLAKTFGIPPRELASAIASLRVVDDGFEDFGSAWALILVSYPNFGWRRLCSYSMGCP